VSRNKGVGLSRAPCYVFLAMQARPRVALLIETSNATPGTCSTASALTCVSTHPGRFTSGSMAAAMCCPPGSVNGKETVSSPVEGQAMARVISATRLPVVDVSFGWNALHSHE